MLKRLFSVLAAVLTTGMVLAACQTTNHAAATADEATVQIAGDWQGHFINKQNKRFALNFSLKSDNGRLSGKASVPSSSHDKNPDLTGKIEGNTVTLTSSSKFYFDLHMTKDDKGVYHLSGPVTGPNTGRLVAHKVN